MRFGYSFPTEHGLTGIWSGTLIFGLILGSVDNTSLLGVFLSLLFSFGIILSYEAIRTLISSKFKSIIWMPLLSLFLLSFGLLVWNFSIYSLIFFGLLAAVVVFWAYFALQEKRQSYVEIIFGSLAMTLQFPIIYNTINQIIDLEHFLYILAVWWIYSGVVLILIINVGCYRGKMGHAMPLYVWVVYFITFIPMFLLGYLEPIALILMIEPTFRGIRQLIKKETMRDKRKNIKKIGWEMIYSLYLFILLVLTFALLKIPLTALEY